MAGSNNRRESAASRWAGWVSCCSAVWAACLGEQLLVNALSITSPLPPEGSLCALFSWLVLWVASSCSPAAQLLLPQLPAPGVLAGLRNERRSKRLGLTSWHPWTFVLFPLIFWIAGVLGIRALDPAWFYSGVEKGRREGDRGSV